MSQRDTFQSLSQFGYFLTRPERKYSLHCGKSMLLVMTPNYQEES